MLVKEVFIRRFIAALMLVVFSFSITPTILLHNWLADHTDTFKKTGGCDTEQVGTKKFYCHCDNIVAESPFTETATFILEVPEKRFRSESGSYIPETISFPQFYFSLRGPPAV